MSGIIQCSIFKIITYGFTTKLVSNRSLATELGLRRKTGAYVKAVTPGSPADEAKLRVGDVVTEFNGIRVQDDDHLINLVSLTPINEVVVLNVMRDREEYMIHVRVGRRRDFEPTQSQARLLNK